MTNARGAARADRTAEPAVRSALVAERHSSYQLGVPRLSLGSAVRSAPVAERHSSYPPAELGVPRLSLGSTERFRVSVVLGLGLIGLVLGLPLTD